MSTARLDATPSSPVSGKGAKTLYRQPNGAAAGLGLQRNQNRRPTRTAVAGVGSRNIIAAGGKRM